MFSYYNSARATNANLTVRVFIQCAQGGGNALVQEEGGLAVKMVKFRC